MHIEVRTRGEVDVVDVTVDSAGNVGEWTLHERLEQLLAAGHTLFILNMTGGPTLDSDWLGELVASGERVRKHQGAVKLVVTPQQLDVLAAIKLDALFETFQDEEDALDSFVPWYATDGIP